MKSRKQITKVFNVALFLYFVFNSFLSYLFNTAGDKRVPWDKVYELSPAYAVIGALLFVLIFTLVGSVITKIFWNRFIADVFDLREITFDESLSIILIIGIISI